MVGPGVAEGDAGQHGGKSVPKLSIFAGEDAQTRNTVTFPQFMYEVGCLLRDPSYPEERVRFAVRRALVGDAARVLVSLGDQVTTSQILEELGTFFGARTPLNLMVAFNSATQRKDEAVTSWAIRLSALYKEMCDAGLGDTADRDNKLRLQFWVGMLPALKLGNNYVFNSIVTFDAMVKHMRGVEETAEAMSPVPHLVTEAPTGEITEPDKTPKPGEAGPDQLKLLQQEVDSLKQQVASAQKSRREGNSLAPPRSRPRMYGGNAPRQAGPGACWQCGEVGHFRRECPTLFYPQGPPYPPRAYTPNPASQYGNPRIPGVPSGTTRLAIFKPQSSLKLKRADDVRQSSAGPSPSPRPSPPVRAPVKRGPILADTDIVTVLLNGVKTLALPDTGSSISTIGRSYFRKQFPQVELCSIPDTLSIECGNGESLPYEGVAVLMLEVENTGFQLEVPLLVIKDHNYHKSHPVVIGQNVLKPMFSSNKFGAGMSDRAARLWKTVKKTQELAHHCVTTRDGRVALLSVMGAVQLPPRSAIKLLCNLRQRVDLATGALISALPDKLRQSCGLSKLIEVTPVFVPYSGHHTAQLTVELVNPSDQTVSLKKNQFIAELTAVDNHYQINKVNKFTLSRAEFLGQFNIHQTNLNRKQIALVHELLWKYRDVFSQSEFDIGGVSCTEHRIRLTNNTPFQQRHRRIPPGMIQELREHIQHLLEIGVITESQSPYASAVVLVRKKNGSLRMCVDYRQLNQLTVKDSFALPRIEELTDSLTGCRYFSTLDMRSGYYQVPMDPADREKTAFTVGPLGFFEFTRLPFGLTGAPATFQRLVTKVLGDLHMKSAFPFLDDIMVPGRTFEEELGRLEAVFAKFREFKLKLHPEKSKFFQSKVVYCGSVVSEKGVEPDPNKVNQIKQWPVPSNQKALRSFLGLASYYRKFVPNFASIARPLNDLLGEPGGRKKSRATKSNIPKQWCWSSAQQTAFDTLKEKLVSPPVLAYPDFSFPFILHVDASRSGLGATLCQLYDHGERPIAYASRGLSATERLYPAHKLEFLALKWAVTEKFADYLYGHTFTVYTDNNPLTYVLTSAKLDATGHRWLAALATYDFDIKYKPGRNNSDVDALSRLTNQDTGYIAEDSIKALYTLLHVPNVAESICKSPVVIDDYISGHVNFKEWRAAQLLDPAISKILQYVTRQEKPPTRNNLVPNSDFPRYVRQYPKLVIKNGVLFRKKIDDTTMRDIFQLVLPPNYRQLALQGLHDDIGHLGRERTLDLVQQRFYWPRMYTDVCNKIHSCERCIKRKQARTDRAPLVNIKATRPMELVTVDYLGIEMSQGGYKNVLVITDHFTKYAWAIPTTNQTAKTTANALYYQFFLHYGFPQYLLSDQGTNFKSQLIAELCNLIGTKKLFTSVYHPQTDGSTERMNRTLLGMLGTLRNNQKHDWKSHVAPLVHAYNATRHESTGFAPAFLMFGRHPRLPIDLILGLPDSDGNDSEDYNSYVSTLKSRLTEAYTVAEKCNDRARVTQKKHYDKKCTGSVLSVGDRVLVRKLAFQGKHKIADRWEPNAYVVVAQPNSTVPVFQVKREDSRGETRTLHRNVLLPIGTLPIHERDDIPPTPPTPEPQPTVPRIAPHHPSPPPSSRYSSDDSTSSSDSDESDFALPNHPRRDSPIPAVQGDTSPAPVSSEDDADSSSGSSSEEEGDDPPVTPRQLPRRSSRRAPKPDRYGNYKYFPHSRGNLKQATPFIELLNALWTLHNRVLALCAN